MIFGDAASWRTRLIDVHSEILSRIAIAWPQCASHFNSLTSEDRITDQLTLALRRDSVCRRFLIFSQYRLLSDDCKGDVVTKGVVDIAVFMHLNNDIYLAFECKRLSLSYSGRRSSQAGAYTEQGLMRFVSAQYAQSLPSGAMIGYVMDGDVEWSRRRLAAAIGDRAPRLRLEGSFEELPAVEFIRCFRTLHYRDGDQVAFEVRHSLLPLQD